MYTIKEVAELLGVSLGVVYRDVHTGRLVAHRFGRRTYRVSEENLQRYLERSETAESPTSASRPSLTNRSTKNLESPAFKHLDAGRLSKAWSR